MDSISNYYPRQVGHSHLLEELVLMKANKSNVNVVLLMPMYLMLFAMDIILLKVLP